MQLPFITFEFLPSANAEVAPKLERHSLGAAVMPREFNNDGKRRIARAVLGYIYICKGGMSQLHKGFC